jgi:hypothetical protein
MKGKLTLASGGAAAAAQNWPGGKAMFIAKATWGGGNVKLQMPAGDGTYVDVANSTLSADGTLTVELPAGNVKAVITTATDVYASLHHIPI